MVIVNESSYVLVINGKNLDPTQEMTVEENIFNSQIVFSDIGTVEIVTEYSNRKFHCYGQLTAYEHEELKDSEGLPYIIIRGDNHE